jgi:hypothetical protein
VISEYAFGHYAWVLSLMFLCLSGAMTSFFDITHEIGHAIAGFLGVIGFPIAALLLSVALDRNENWRAARTRLL